MELVFFNDLSAIPKRNPGCNFVMSSPAKYVLYEKGDFQ